ncbi:radical SAM domain-containing protein [Besnoitia besnoiti]|uniref:Radical SAM domain-containing protein n=1 Tax=Besnoitia besnoiti TaxID=94643 RepID=A0A2A9M712_BESBE|nr:radical SAM domain-containing protein [Besnoitia besnoiti]PFH31172.1 radical SAM domain-containing protein [Besnoitia besnoiti]
MRVLAQPRSAPRAQSLWRSSPRARVNSLCGGANEPEAEQSTPPQRPRRRAAPPACRDGLSRSLSTPAMSAASSQAFASPSQFPFQSRSFSPLSRSLSFRASSLVARVRCAFASSASSPLPSPPANPASSEERSPFPATASPRLQRIQRLLVAGGFEPFRYKQILEHIYRPTVRQAKGASLSSSLPSSSSSSFQSSSGCEISEMKRLGKPLVTALRELFGEMYGGRGGKRTSGALQVSRSDCRERDGAPARGEAVTSAEGADDGVAQVARAPREAESFLSIAKLEEKSDKKARKILFQCRQDDARVEAVALAFPNHTSLCVSSQAGCAFNCSFCSVGKSGFLRHLTADEITDQVLFFLREGIKIDSVSFMGMGEPLANPKVFDALRILTDPLLFNFSARKLAVSTLGVLSGIKKLTLEFPQVNLAFSLHSPFPEERNLLVPANSMYPMEEVFELLDERLAKTGRRIWISYILIKGRNNSEAHARALAELLRDRRRETRHLYHVNVIPYNKGKPFKPRMESPSSVEVNSFTDILRKLNLSVSRRHTFGTTIDAACGQMHAEYEIGQLTQQRKAQERARKKAILAKRLTN